MDLSTQLAGKQVKALEQSLSVKLLNRTTRRQSLTDSGRAFTSGPSTSLRKWRLPRP
jgi:DNA-binding transcriptional LysR family regulator